MNYTQASKYIKQATDLYIDDIYTYSSYIAVLKPLAGISDANIYKLINDSIELVEGFELSKDIASDD